MLIKKRFIPFLFLFSFFNYFSQDKKLEDLSFVELENKIDCLIDHNDNYFPVINFYIKKAKKEKNSEALLYAYRYASKTFINDKIGIKYADSAILIGKKHNNLKFLSEAYLNKGTFFIERFKYVEALNNITIANQYAINLKDNYIIHKSLYFIAQSKIFLGQEKDAIKDLEKCILFFKTKINNKKLGEDYNTYYIYSLMSLIDCNSKTNNSKNNKKLYEDAFNYIKISNEKHLIPYFISYQGTDYYHKGNYHLAINKLKKAIQSYNDVWPHYTEVFYIGQSYWKLGNKEEAIKYFEKLDKEYYADKNQDPQFRHAYELLIEYYESKNNTDKQLEYINKLMILDKSYEKNYKYLFSKINKEYDTQKLVDEKKKIENSLKLHQFLTVFLIISCIIIFTLIVYKYKSTQKEYIKTFKKIIADKQNQEKINTLKTNNQLTTDNKENLEFFEKIPGLNEDTLKNILNQLDVFEKENQFLDSQISQLSLSEKFGTNPSYLSKIIKIYKEKNYNQYINDLRIDYIINLLQQDSKMLNKDIKELAIIAGFGNSESFSDHFKRKLKITPTLFIKMMKDEIKNHS